MGSNLKRQFWKNSKFQVCLSIIKINDIIYLLNAIIGDKMKEFPVQGLMTLELVRLLVIGKGKHGIASFRLSPLLDQFHFFL